MIGEAIGSYRIVGKLGEGGMGAVYVAHHALLGRKAAIKVLLPALSRQPEVVERFFNEARAVTSMSDPGIVQIFDFGYHTDGSAFLVMELLEGEPLNNRLAARGRLGAVEALRIGRQVAVSLGTAHGRGIVHRDLKPENVFMVRDAEIAHGERAKILDFGIAKLSGDGNSRKTSTGALLGTPTYMSPEQCRGAGEVDHRSDIYALGCMLFHLLTGAPPFLGEGIGDIIAAHLREPAPPPSSRAAGIPPALDALVLRCLAKAAGDRPQTMGELAAAIDQLLTQQASAEKATYMLPVAAGRTPSPLLTPPGAAWPAGTSNPGAAAGPSGASYPVAAYPAYPSGPSGLGSVGGGYATPAPAAGASQRGLMAPLSMTPAPTPHPGQLAGASGAPGSYPGVAVPGSPTTLGSAASQQAVAAASSSTGGRVARLFGGLAFAGVLAVAGVFVVGQRDKGGGGDEVRAAAGAAAVEGAGSATAPMVPSTTPTPPSPATTAKADSGTGSDSGTATGSASGTATGSASGTATGSGSGSVSGPDSGSGSIPPTALKDPPALADATAPAADEPKTRADKLDEEKPSAPSRRRARSSRSRSSSSSTGGCDRSVDTDCDGIPDVR